MESTPVMKLNSVGYLRLAYVATEITLHRRIMLALSASTDPQLYQVCRSVARERFIFAIDFVQSLKPQHLSSFWYFASPQNFALIGVFGVLLLSTASNDEEAGFYRTKLREYRWTLKINTENGARYMKPAMALLDANMELLNKAGSQYPPHSTLPGASKSQSEQRNPASVSGANDTFVFSNTTSASSGNFTSAGNYNFEQPYYPGQIATISAANFAPETLDAQSQEFVFGIGSAGMWSY